MNQVKQPEVLSTIWDEHIKSWQKTQLSQSAYRPEKNIYYHHFSYWRP